MYNILKISWIILGTLLMTTGYNQKPLTNTEKLYKIIKVQKDETPNKKETVELYGFNIPCYLIFAFDREPIDYKDTPYPHITWFSDSNRLMLFLSDQYPKNGGETYKLENFLTLKFDKKTVDILIDKFKTRKTEVIDPKDGTYILFSTGTDDTRVVTIGNIEDLQKYNNPENQLPPTYELKQDK